LETLLLPFYANPMLQLSKCASSHNRVFIT
jgi:hypothetical protein